MAPTNDSKKSTKGNGDDAEAAAKNKELSPPEIAAIEAIEEDDEFEEFEPAHWAAGEEDAEDAQQWQDNWDMDDMDDDFTKNLRAELMQHSGGSSGGK